MSPAPRVKDVSKRQENRTSCSAATDSASTRRASSLGGETALLLPLNEDKHVREAEKE
jgi:hypothetical protein